MTKEERQSLEAIKQQCDTIFHKQAGQLHRDDQTIALKDAVEAEMAKVQQDTDLPTDVDLSDPAVRLCFARMLGQCDVALVIKKSINDYLQKFGKD